MVRIWPRSLLSCIIDIISKEASLVVKKKTLKIVKQHVERISRNSLLKSLNYWYQKGWVKNNQYFTLILSWSWCGIKYRIEPVFTMEIKIEKLRLVQRLNQLDWIFYILREWSMHWPLIMAIKKPGLTTHQLQLLDRSFSESKWRGFGWR